MSDLAVDVQLCRDTFKLAANFALKNSHITVILGASGSGKSTLLRLLAGLETADKGNIVCNGQDWLNTQKNINLSAQKRCTGFVFQDYALFENMTVKDNIGFGVSRKQRSKVVGELSQKLELQAFAAQYPAQLSGGQKQRVALGRALAIKPNLLLLDEPLSAIDFNLRKQLQRELKQMIKTINCPVILVTHDLDEARLMADYLIIMSEGKIIRQGEADEVLMNPLNQQSARILAWQNFLPIEQLTETAVQTAWGKFSLNTQIYPEAKFITIKPEKIRFTSALENSVPVTVTEINDYGVYKEFRCQLDEKNWLIVHRPAEEPAPALNSVTRLHLSSECLMLLVAEESNSAESYSEGVNPGYQRLVS